MLTVHLDTRDYIDLFRKRTLLEDFQDRIAQGHLRLVVSMVAIWELARGRRSGTPHDLRRLAEELEAIEATDPLYIDASPALYELREARNAFAENREPSSVSSLVLRSSYSEAVIPDHLCPPVLAQASLRSAVSLILNAAPEQLDLDRSLTEAFRGRMNEWRTLKNRNKAAFIDNWVPINCIALDKLLSNQGLAPLPRTTRSFGEWLWNDRRRCPGLRMCFDVRYQLMRNLGDALDEGDFGDLQMIAYLPYVRAATLDKRMRDLVHRATRDLPAGSCAKTFPSIQAILEWLGDGAATASPV